MPADLRHLRSFVVVAEEAHIGRAAARLFITQPALSRQMQRLEREVGAQLLVRTARGVELTAAGSELLVRARVALQAAEDALAVGRLDQPRGPLTLGLPLAGTRERWFGLVQAYTQRYPQVELRLREAMTEPLQDQLLAGQLDAVLGLAPSRLAGLTYTHVHDEPLAVWLHDEHPLADRGHLALRDLEGVRVTLVSAARSGFNAAVRAVFADAGVQPAFVATPELFPARAGHDPGFLGVSVLIDFPTRVRRVPLQPAPTLSYELVQRAGISSPAARAFAPFAAEHLRASCTPDMTPT